MRLPAFVRRPRLEDVFGMSTAPISYTYVDRAQLDERLQAAKRANKHVAIHGESKHGKSWLRAKGLPDSEVARVQCIPGMTADQVLESALGRLGINVRLKLTFTDTTEDTVRVSVEAAHGPLRVGGGGDSREEHARQVEEAPVGQGPTDLGWVAEQFRTSTRQPVFEDFHNLSTEEQRRMSFVIKALGEWHVPCAVVGIWTDTHLLTYYNGELDGRIDDLQVRWTGAELQRVVRHGCRSLKVELSDALVRRVVEDAYTSVGLLQQLMYELLWEAGVRRRKLRTQTITEEGVYEKARVRVVKQIAGRFDPFIDRAAGGSVELTYLLWAVTERFDDGTLLEGVAAQAVADELIVREPGMTLERAVILLEGLHAFHREQGVRPAVLAYDPARQRLILADRRFLLYRRRVSRKWPWNP